MLLGRHLVLASAHDHLGVKHQVLKHRHRTPGSTSRLATTQDWSFQCVKAYLPQFWTISFHSQNSVWGHAQNVVTKCQKCQNYDKHALVQAFKYNKSKLYIIKIRLAKSLIILISTYCTYLRRSKKNIVLTLWGDFDGLNSHN